MLLHWKVPTYYPALIWSTSINPCVLNNVRYNLAFFLIESDLKICSTKKNLCDNKTSVCCFWFVSICFFFVCFPVYLLCLFVCLFVCLLFVCLFLIIACMYLVQFILLLWAVSGVCRVFIFHLQCFFSEILNCITRICQIRWETSWKFWFYFFFRVI